MLFTCENWLGKCLNLRSNDGVFVRVGLWMKGENLSESRGEVRVASGSGCRGRRIPTIFQRNIQKHSPTRTKCGLFSGKAQSWKLYRSLGNGKFKICPKKKCLQAMKSISENILKWKRVIPRTAHAFKLRSQSGPLIGPAHSVYFSNIWVWLNWYYISVVYFFIAVIKSKLFLCGWAPSFGNISKADIGLMAEHCAHRLLDLSKFGLFKIAISLSAIICRFLIDNFKCIYSKNTRKKRDFRPCCCI